MNWKPVPGREKHLQPQRSAHSGAGFKVTSITQLKKYDKVELAGEVHRLQKLLREIGVEIGVIRRTNNSELGFDVHFIGSVKTLLTIGWSLNL